MSTLTIVEKNKLEKLFRMSTGQVLGFTNASFQSLVADSVGLDIMADKYGETGTSKAKRLREFWRSESDQTVGKLL